MKKEMRNWKFAQASVFVIVAIVILAVVILGIFLSKKNSGFDIQFSSDPQVQAQFNNIKDSVQSCMKYTSMDALEIIGYQGGYYKEPKDYFDLRWVIIPYYYKEGQILMPATSEIQNQLSLYVDDNLNPCFDDIKADDFEIIYKKPKTTANIYDGEVSFRIDMPLSIQKDAKIVKLDLRDNLIRIPSKLFNMLEIAKYITDSHRNDSENICINCVADMARERDLYVDMLDFGDNSTTLIVISTNTTEFEPFAFEFLNKYPDEEVMLPSAPND